MCQHIYTSVSFCLSPIISIKIYLHFKFWLIHLHEGFAFFPKVNNQLFSWGNVVSWKVLEFETIFYHNAQLSLSAKPGFMITKV